MLLNSDKKFYMTQLVVALGSSDCVKVDGKFAAHSAMKEKPHLMIWLYPDRFNARPDKLLPVDPQQPISIELETGASHFTDERGETHEIVFFKDRPITSDEIHAMERSIARASKRVQEVEEDPE